MMARWAVAAAVCGTLLAAAARAQDPPPPTPADLINGLLAGLMGFKEVSAEELQEDVAEAGGVPFKAPVPVDFITPADLTRYLKEVLDSEYPPSRADADGRLLVALDLLPPGTSLRDLRMRLLQDNVAGFYDERPGRRKLYAVSEERTMTPSNQIVLAHEMRHALQDQYIDVHRALPDAVGDFDDRRLALMALLEGDATVVMERFLMQRLGVLESTAVPDLAGAGFATPELEGVPPVLRDHLILPYLAGREFVRALHDRGGWAAVRKAWADPPRSTEQVLHPEKYAAREQPQAVGRGTAPAGARLLAEGVLGEALTRTLLGEGSDVAAAGWGGDLYQVWDAAGRTLVVWRTSWDSEADAREFHAAAGRRFTSSHGRARRLHGAELYGRGRWNVGIVARSSTVTLVAGDDAGRFADVLKAEAR
jgi:hypothetical protein